MASLDTQTKYIRAVVNFPISSSLPFACENLARRGYRYALIVHDQDIRDDGTLKTPHIHVVIEAQKRARLGTTLIRLADDFGVNENQVSVQSYDDFAFEVQYLIHKNNPEKFQYDKSLIKSNLSEDDIISLLAQEVAPKLTIQDLYAICSSTKSRYKIACKIGLGNYGMYRNVISDLLKELYGC
jgi:hypothetical protein